MPMSAAVINQMDGEKVACVSPSERFNAASHGDGNITDNNNHSNKSDCQNSSSKHKQRPVESGDTPSPSLSIVETSPETAASGHSTGISRPEGHSRTGTSKPEETIVCPIASAEKGFGRGKENQSVDNGDAQCNQIDGQSDRQANSDQVSMRSGNGRARCTTKQSCTVCMLILARPTVLFRVQALPDQVVAPDQRRRTVTQMAPGVLQVQDLLAPNGQRPVVPHL